MANTLGTIAVDLTANTASFVSGLATASSAAKRAGSEITESFSRVGELAASALAPFGEVGRVIGETFSSIGRLAGGASQELAKLSGGMSYLTVGAGVAAGAIAGVTAASIGLAVHTAESVREMADQARAVGVSIDRFSALSFAAKQAGVPQEALTKILGTLSLNMLKAATAAPGTATAFSRFGLSVKDGNGQLKDAGDFLIEVIEKLDSLKDRTAAVGAARQMFGRGGQEVLKFDPAETAESIETAKKLGIVIGPDMAEASTKFVQSMNVIKAAGEGVALQLTKALLPALQAVANQMKEGLEDKGSGLSDFISGIKTITEYMVSLLGLGVFVFEEIGAAAAAVIADIRADFEELVAEAKALKHLDFSGVEAAWKDAAVKRKGIDDDFIAHSKANWKSYTDLLTNAFKDSPDSTVHKPHGKDTGDLSPKEARQNAIAVEIGKLLAQMDAEASLATAISNTTANTLLAVAAAEAKKDVDELVIKAAREKVAVTEDEKNAVRDAVLFTQAYKAVYEDNKKLQEFIDKTREQTASLLNLAAAYEKGDEAIASAKQAEKLAPFQKQAADIKELIDLLKQGKTEEFKKSLEGSIAALSKLGLSAEQLKPMREALGAMSKGANPLDPLIHGYDELIERLKTASAEEKKASEAGGLEATKSALKSLTTQIEEQKKYTFAILAGADALRQFNIEKQVTSFKDENAKKGNVISPDEESAYRAALQKRLNEERISAAAQQVSATQSFEATQDRISGIKLLIQQLETQRLLEIKLGEDTADVDRKLDASNLLLYQDKIKAEVEYQQKLFQAQNAQLLGAAQVYDANERMIQQWDAAIAKVGTFAGRFKGLMNELALEGQNFSGKVFDSLRTAIDGMETQLAKLVVTGKANFKDVLKSMEESIVKAGIQKGVGALAGAIGLKIPGLGGKPDGTASNPLHVIMGGPGIPGVGGDGSVGGVASSAMGGLGNIPIVGGIFKKLGGLFGGGGDGGLGRPDGSEGNPFYVVSADSSASGGAGGLSGLLSSFMGGGDSGGSDGGGIGGAIGGIASIFSGFLADGGDVTPGKAYVVGEKNPEFFLPKRPGTVVPSLKMGGDTVHHTTVNFHVHGVQDVDSFRRSQSQIFGDMHRQMTIAHARNY